MSENKETIREHPALYTRTELVSMWQFNGKDFDYITTTNTSEFDRNLKDFVKVKTETKKQKPEDLGYVKELKFVIAYPEQVTPTKQTGARQQKNPKLFMLKGIVKVRDTEKFTWLFKQYQKPIDREGSTGRNLIFVKCLDKFGKTYAFAFKSNDEVQVLLDDEESDTTVAELKKLESEGMLICYYNQANYDSGEGWTFGVSALELNL
jgi:hypothetical protein